MTRPALTPGICDNCGAQIKIGNRFCSDDCRRGWYARAQRLGRANWPEVVRAVLDPDEESQAARMAEVMRLAEQDARAAPAGLFAQPRRGYGEEERS